MAMTSPPGKQNTAESRFEQQATESAPSIASELLDFLKHEKKWWLLPILVVICLLGLIVTLGSTGAGAFIYTLF